MYHNRKNEALVITAMVNFNSFMTIFSYKLYDSLTIFSSYLIFQHVIFKLSNFKGGPIFAGHALQKNICSMSFYININIDINMYMFCLIISPLNLWKVSLPCT